MFLWPCIMDINNVGDQLDATITIYWYSNHLNTFRTIFCPSSGALDFVLQLVVKCTPSCCRPVVWKAEALTMCSVWRMLLEQHPSHRTHSQYHRPATTTPNTQSVPRRSRPPAGNSYTEHIVSASAFQTTGRQQLGCKTQPYALEDGQKIARNMLSWLEYQ